MKSRRSHFANALVLYGKDAFSHEILEVCETLEAANAAEERWILHFDTRNPAKGFNLMKGGAHVPHPFRNPWDRSEYREKMKRSVLPKLIASGHSADALAKSKATLNTPEVRERCAAAQRGKVMSEIHRSRISENMRRLQLSRSDHELSEQSARMTTGRRRRESEMTSSEREAARLRHSLASKLKSASLRTPESIAKHRMVCAAKRILDPEKTMFALSLVGLGYSDGDIAWLLKTKKDVIRLARRRNSP